MPNTAVKLLSVEDSEGLPLVKAERRRSFFNLNTFYSAIAQSVEHVTVNHAVAGSSPACGVFLYIQVIF